MTAASPQRCTRGGEMFGRKPDKPDIKKKGTTAMASFNKITIVVALGRDSEIRHTPQDTEVRYV
jgi:glycerol-3-phosphate O-acyltransferase